MITQHAGAPVRASQCSALASGGACEAGRLSQRKGERNR